MSSASPIRVALADDQAILRRGLAALLALESGIDVVGGAATCAETVAMVERARPNVLLLDVQMPGVAPTHRPTGSRSPNACAAAPAGSSC